MGVFESTVTLGTFAPGATISVSIAARLTCVSGGSNRHVNAAQTATWTIVNNGVRINGNAVTPLAGSTTTLAAGPAATFPNDGTACAGTPQTVDSTVAQRTTVNVAAPTACGSGHSLTVAFDNGDLDPNGTNDSTSLTGSLATATYNFSVSPCVLTVNVSGTGDGSVSDGTGEIVTCTDSGGDCTGSFVLGSSVTLTATPDTATSFFAAWGGSGLGTCTSTTPNPLGDSCTFTMNAPRTVNATFTPIERALAVSVTGNGTVMDGPEGIISCTSAAEVTCSDTYPHGTAVTLTAAPDANWEFVSWGGDCAGQLTATCSLTMDAAKTASVTFQLIPRNLTVATAGTGTGTVEDGPEGDIDCTLNAGTCSDTYPHGTSVTLTATSDSNSTFGGWSGADSAECAAPTNPICTLSMVAAKSLTATFTAIPYDLNVTVVGNGTVTSDPGSISCTSAAEVTCSDTYDAPTVVTLSAAPDANWEFDGWSGDDAEDCVSATADVCALTMTEQRDVTANFSTIQHLVTVTVSGNGDVTADTGTIDCPDVDCTDLYDQASTVILTADPDDDHEFDNWTGTGAASCAEGAASAVCTLTIDAAKTVQANISTIQHLVTVTVSGNGDVTADTGTIDCPDVVCTDLYDQASTVILTADPDDDHEFDNWTGTGAASCAEGAASAVCTLTIDAAKTVQANFSTIQWNLNVAVLGNGDVTSSVGTIDCPDVDCSDTYDQPTLVTLTADPDADHEFDTWSGADAAACAGGLTNPICALTMTEQRDVTANFSTIQHLVTVTVSGNGDVTADTGTIDCPDVDCTDLYDQASTVILTADPDDDHEFDNWTGTGAASCAEGAASAVCTLTIDAAKTVQANISTIQHLVTVTVSGNGDVTADTGTIDCPDVVCTDLYDQASTVILTADPDDDHEFDNWTGTGAASCAEGAASAVCTLTIDAAKTVQANFSTIQWNLNVAVLGNGDVTSSVGTIDCPDVDCSDTYDQPTVVTLTADPDADHEFDTWSGADAAACAGGLTNPICALTMTEQRDVTANFSTIQHLVTVTVSGNGDVTADTGTIDCPDVDCTDLYDQASTVILTADPDDDHEFDNWTGTGAASCAEGAASAVCTLTIDAAKTVQANISTIQRDLNVTVVGNGDVTSNVGTIDCPDVDCSDTYNQPTVVTITANPTDANSQFDTWSGADAADCAGGLTNSICALTMTEQMDVTATFSGVPRQLDVVLAGTGSGSVTDGAAGDIDCPGTCTDTYPHGMVVTLTASADPGSDFAGWTGDVPGTCSGIPVTCQVTMDAAKTVTATFDPEPPPADDADLAIAMADVNDPVRVGRRIIYRITVANNGPVDATNVVMIDQLPSSVTFVSATTDQGSCIYSSSKHRVRCQLGTVLDGGFARIEITVQTHAVGDVVNGAGVVSSVDDPDLDNNSARARTSVQP